MADYHPLIARAVEGLGTGSGEARRALYERARTALVAQLRTIEPPLSEADITRERLALEDAIRKVEAETARNARTEPRPATPPLRPSAPIATPQPPPPPAMPPLRPSAPIATPQPPPPPAMPPLRPSAPVATPQAPQPPALPPRPDRPLPPPVGTSPAPRPATAWPDMQRPGLRRAEPPPPRNPNALAPDAAPQTAAQPSARSRILSARTAPIAGKRLNPRDVVNEADDLGPASARSAQSARDTRDSYGTSSAQPFSYDDDAAPLHTRAEPHFDADEADLLDDNSQVLRDLEPSAEFEDDEWMQPPHVARQRHPRGREPDEHDERQRSPRSYRGLAKFAVTLIVLGGLVTTISWQWSNINDLYQSIWHRSRPVQTTQAPPGISKSDDRVPQQQAAGQTPASGAPGQQAGPQVAQRVVLYEEDPNDPQGKRYVGSAVWRTDTVSPGSGLAPELEVRADITIPDKSMTVTFALRRNTDQALPASHTIEITFNVPPDFPGGGIANVPGVLMKESEQARGVPLAGLAVKVTNGFFLVGLSAVDTDVQRNMQLLKDRPWFDIPIVYNNGGRAILALEKGPPGDRAFADAFAAWGK